MLGFIFNRSKSSGSGTEKTWKIWEVKAKRAEAEKMYAAALELYQKAYKALEQYYDSYKNRESKYFQHKSSEFRFKMSELENLLNNA
jgi:hypothetical protein